MSSASQPFLTLATHLARNVSLARSLRIAQSWACLSCRIKQQGLPDHSKIVKRALSSSRQKHSDVSQRTFTGNGLTPAASSTSLPSHTAKQRSAFTKRVSEITDSILARASIAGQHINTYTGTDYSGIEALRKDIIEREVEVKTKLTTVSAAKMVHTDARAKQASSQKEIVGLLERKSSWSPADLERYMSLVRSEHIDDQAVQKAAEELTMAERELEDTRSLLERLERKQYHEEQIWSDTIRRNSTWVTIGLMGINILLLLAQISVFEPYRRRKIVKQIEQALDERTALALQKDSIVREFDLVVEPAGVTLEELEGESAVAELTPSGAFVPAQPSLMVQAAPSGTLNPAESSPAIQAIPTQTPEGLVQQARSTIHNLFSDRAVTLKQVDVTTLALEGLAAGMAIGGAVAMIFLRSSH